MIIERIWYSILRVSYITLKVCAVMLSLLIIVVVFTLHFELWHFLIISWSMTSLKKSKNKTDADFNWEVYFFFVEYIIRVLLFAIDHTFSQNCFLLKAQESKIKEPFIATFDVTLWKLFKEKCCNTNLLEMKSVSALWNSITVKYQSLPL